MHRLRVSRGGARPLAYAGLLGLGLATAPEAKAQSQGQQGRKEWQVNTEIKAVVEELKRLDHAASPAPWKADTWEAEIGGYAAVGPRHDDREDEDCDAFACAESDALLMSTVRNALPALITELRRLWAIEEAAVRYREAWHAFDNYRCVDSTLDELEYQVDYVTKPALFAALDAKPAKEEQ